MSDTKDIQAKVIQQLHADYGYFDYEQNLEDIVTALIPLRKPEMSDDDFIRYSVSTIAETYDLEHWYDSTKVYER